MKSLIHIKSSIQTKFIFIFLLLLLLLSICIGAITYNVSYSRVLNEYASLGAKAAEVTTFAIDGDRINLWLKNGQDEEYYETKKALEDIKRVFGLKYLYVFVPDLNENNTRYIFDIVSEDEDSENMYLLGDESGSIDVYDLVMHVYHLKKGVISGVVTKSEFGYLTSSYYPVMSSSNPDEVAAVVGIDVEMSMVINDVKGQTIQILGISLLILIAFGIIFTRFINRKIIHPIKQLSAYMERFVRNDVQLETQRLPEIQSGDEIETIYDDYNKMVDSIVNYTDTITRVTADKERIATELSVASQIQMSMLPCIFPPFPDRQDFSIFALMHPAKEVGGDFYDFFLIDENKLCVLVADVSGKGIPAAMVMVIARILIKNQMLMNKPSHEVFASVNNMLCENNEAGMFITVFMGILYLDTGKFKYVNAGHNYPLVKYKRGNTQWLKQKANMFLGGIEDMKYKEYELVLKEGDMLIMYTDGVTEALNEHQNLYGDPRLLRVVESCSGETPKQMVDRIQADIRDFVDEEEQSDDLTLLALCYSPETVNKNAFVSTHIPKAADDRNDNVQESIDNEDVSASFECIVEADLDHLDDVISFVEEKLSDADCPAKIQMKICLVVEELFVNIVSYAYGEEQGKAKINMKMNGNTGVSITLTDTGKPFNPLLREDPDVSAPAEEREIGGLGIYIAKTNMDHLFYEYQDGENRLTIEKSFTIVCSL